MSLRTHCGLFVWPHRHLADRGKSKEHVTILVENDIPVL